MNKLKRALILLLLITSVSTAGEYWYKVIRSSNYSEFVQEVNAALGLGWRTVGGVAIASSAGTTYYYQAIIRETVR